MVDDPERPTGFNPERSVQMKAPVRYFGGKGGMLTKLLSYFPDPSLYDTYVDAYGGAGTVLLAMSNVGKAEIFNDLDGNIYALFSVLRDPVLFEQFRRLAELSLYDERTAKEFRQELRRADLTLLERAYRFWYVARVFRAGSKGGFAVNPAVRRRMSLSTSHFLSSVENLLPLHQRLSSVVVRNWDAIDLIKLCDHDRTFIYLDPPYHPSTRSSTRYTIDADEHHHVALINALNQVQQAYVVLSGYDTPVYDGLAWHKEVFRVKARTGNNRMKDTNEVIWRNFEPAALAFTEPMFQEDQSR